MRLDDLCRLLAVTPEERSALSQQRLWLGTPAGEKRSLSLLVAGLLLGAVGSGLTLRRFLQV